MRSKSPRRWRTKESSRITRRRIELAAFPWIPFGRQFDPPPRDPARLLRPPPPRRLRAHFDSRAVSLFLGAAFESETPGLGTIARAGVARPRKGGTRLERGMAKGQAHPRRCPPPHGPLAALCL